MASTNGPDTQAQQCDCGNNTQDELQNVKELRLPSIASDAARSELSLQNEWFCSICLKEWAEDTLADDARSVAEALVRVTGEAEHYDVAHHYAPTYEEYAIGDRSAHTSNGVATRNRHCSTNYNELIAELERGNPLHEVYYEAIRARVDELTDPDEPTP